jgi:hypothetical protein
LVSSSTSGHCWYQTHRLLSFLHQSITQRGKIYTTVWWKLPPQCHLIHTHTHHTHTHTHTHSHW